MHELIGSTELLFRDAIFDGDVNRLRELFHEYKKNVENSTKTMLTPSEKVLSCLLKRPPPPRLQNRAFSFGRTLLSEACYYGRMDIVKCLIEEFHADVNYQIGVGWTALMWACSRKHLEIVQYLIENAHANISMASELSNTALSIACIHAESIAIYLINSGAPIDTSHSEWNNLILAARNSGVDLVRHILQTGRVDVNTQDFSGQTALMHSTRNLDTIKYLIEVCHADVNILDNEGRSVLDYVVHSSYEHTKYILSREYLEGLNFKWKVFEDSLYRQFTSNNESLREVLHYIGLRLIRYGSKPFLLSDITKKAAREYDGDVVLKSYQHRYLLIVLTSTEFHSRLVKKNTFIQMLPLDLLKLLFQMLVT